MDKTNDFSESMLENAIATYLIGKVIPSDGS